MFQSPSCPALPSPLPSCPRPCLWDALFLLLVSCYAWAILWAMPQISAGGAVLDSDLCTYAQATAGGAHPELFAADPVLREVTPSSSIQNLQSFLARLLTPGDDYPLGIYRASALIILVFYTAWYLLGRVLFNSPGLAALLSVLAGVTIWLGWGTFWGLTHSDPIPRTCFAAIWPFLLFLVLAAWERPLLRPLTMLLTGLCMWVHGISALNSGAMFFLAFALHRPLDAQQTWGKHALNCLYCLVAFLAPVVIFLWPSVFQSRQFSPEDMAVFQELFSLRWKKDYGRLAERLLALLDISRPFLPLVICGLCGWLLVLWRGSGLARRLAAMYPAFVLALGLVVVFSWLESLYAPQLGRLPLGHELVRGLRFLVPLSWLMLLAAVGLIWCRLPGLLRLVLVAATILGILSFNPDRQNMAAQYGFSQLTGIPLPGSQRAQETRETALRYREAIDQVARLVPPGQLVAASGNDMAVRYLALRPLVHTFKDGYVFFYNKDVILSRQWLHYNSMMQQSPTGYVDVWLGSGAPWLLTHRPQDKDLLLPHGQVVWSNNGWLIVRKQQTQEAE